MKVLLCNDTAVKAHIGCRAVSDAHARMLGRLGHRVVRRVFVGELSDGKLDRFDDVVAKTERDERFMSALEGVDAVVVNGEGTIHHGGGLALLAALRIAKRRGKATALVNCLLEDVRVDAEAFAGFDRLTVRDARSYAYARSLGLDCEQHFDSIVAAKFSGGARGLAGRIAVTDWTKSSDETAGRAASRLLHGDEFRREARFFPMHSAVSGRNWRAAVGSLSGARAVVTARHHGLYLAALAGAPFVALRGHTWKGEGLLASLGGGLPMAADYGQLRAALGGLDALRPRFEEARRRLADAAGLQHFEVFGRGSDSSGEEEEVARLEAEVSARDDLRKLDLKRCRRKRRQEKAWARKIRPSLLSRIFGARPAADDDLRG